MKAHIVETITGLSKQTLYYYETEGLITVERAENGYREYSDENIQTLTIIKYLRSLDISIDDIRLVLAGELSFQSILKLKQDSMSYNIDKQVNLLNTVNTLRKQQIPLIPELEVLESDIRRYPISFWKSTPTITLGRPLTVGLILRQVLSFLLYSFILTIALTIGIPKMIGYQISIFAYFLIFLGIITLICFFAISDFLPTGAPYTGSRFDFIEFNEANVRYYNNGGFLKNIQYIIGVLKGREEGRVKSYEDIESVEISINKRYMKPYGFPSSAPAIPLKSPNFTFNFEDGDKAYLFSPMILNNDSVWVAAIINAKIRNIIDPNNYMDSISK